MAKKKILPKVNFVYLTLAISLILISVGIGYYMSGSVIIKEVSVKGTGMTDHENLKEVISQAVIGIHADSLNLKDIRLKADSFDYVKQTRIFISPTGRMTIEVTEREPLAIMMQGDRLALVDFYGVKMPLPGTRVPDLPLLFGFNALPFTDTLSTDSFKITAQFLSQLKSHSLAFLTISEVGWHPEKGVVALSREQDVELVFGFDDFESRLEYWSGFYREIAPRKGLASYRSLDFRYRGQIIAQNTRL